MRATPHFDFQLGESAEMIRALFVAGADAFRVNMSHGAHEDHAARIATIRALEKEFQRPTTILGDLQGPKLRVGTFEKGLVVLETGAAFVLDRDVDDGAIGGEKQRRDACRVLKRGSIDLRGRDHALVDQVRRLGTVLVVQDQRVLAVEAAEGTDAMLARCASLIDAAATPAVFVKCAKHAQDRRLDIPVIGTDTLRAAKAAHGVWASSWR